MFKFFTISSNVSKIYTFVFIRSLVFKIPRYIIFWVRNFFILQVIKVYNVFSHISDAHLEIAYVSVFGYVINIINYKFSEYQKFRTFHSITTKFLYSIKKSFNWIELWSVWTYSHFITINIAHPPLRDTTIVRSSIIIKIKYILFSHSIIS